MTTISSLEQFEEHVMKSEAFHVVVFTDGLHCRFSVCMILCPFLKFVCGAQFCCSPCKTAASNALRLSSALRRGPSSHAAHVSLVNCEMVEAQVHRCDVSSHILLLNVCRNRPAHYATSIRSCHRHPTPRRQGVTMRASSPLGVPAR
jgi:hypothetical protein